MSDRGSDQTEAVVPFAPKLNPRSDLSDPLEKAGHLIWDMVRQASGNAQASYQQAAEMSCKLTAQLRSAEDRIRELETKLRHHEERADRAERWLRISRWRLSKVLQPRQGGVNQVKDHRRLLVFGCLGMDQFKQMLNWILRTS